MSKILAALILSLSIPAQALAGTLFLLEGQVTEGAGLFPPPPDSNIPHEEFAAPVGGFPVDFVALLSFGPEEDDWTFEFTVFDTVRAVDHTVGDPERFHSHTGFIANVNNVVRTNTDISIEFQDVDTSGVLTSLFEEFNLSIDLDAGTGQWNWLRDCPPCDLAFPLPSASATVTTVTAVPEPATSLIALLAAVLVLMLRSTRRRRTR